MTLDEYKMLKIPDVPGVYQFIGAKGKVLYVGKATSLKDRVRSYFSATVATRGRHVEEMVASAKTIIWEVTDSVLEALVLESALIKKYQPPANTKEKELPQADIDKIVFTSPSTVDHFLQDFKSIPSHWQVVCRGSLTQSRLKQAGYHSTIVVC
jgi:excinuclease UvrABC nuclease subunit